MPRRPEVKDIDQYISIQEPDAQIILTKLRELINKNKPNIVEKISYGMPFYITENGKKIGTAAYKAHVALQISDDLTPETIELANQSDFEMGQKRIIIPFNRDFPATLATHVINDLQ